MGKIFVAGATGNIGYYVVKELVKRGQQVQAGVRQVEKDRVKFQGLKDVTVVEFDFLNPKTFNKALENVDKIFFVRPPQLAKPKEDMLPFLQFAKEKGIERILFVSLLGVEKNPVVPHRKIEDMIRKMDFQYTFLRPSFFMQNLNTTHREDIVKRNELFMPVGKAKTSFIDTRDIGEAAAVCLTESGHEKQAYTLTGSEAISYDEVATIMTDVLGRLIRYTNPGVLQFRSTTIKRGTPKVFANVMTVLYVMTRLGTAKDITSDLEQLIKRKPTSFKQYVLDFKEDFNTI